MKKIKVDKEDHEVLKKNYDEVYNLYSETLELLEQAEEDTINQLNKSVKRMEEFEQMALKYSEIMEGMKKEVLQLKEDMKKYKT
jgi:uncharacterized protein YdcH (DUF465 family)